MIFLVYSFTVIILFNKGLQKSAFSTYSFRKLVARLSKFSVNSVVRFHVRKLDIYVLIFYIGLRYCLSLSSLY